MGPSLRSMAWIVTSLSLMVSAQDFEITGPLLPGEAGSYPNSSQILEDAGRDPNATSMVTFNRTDNKHFGTWGWRVNMTEIPVPDNPADLGSPSANSSEDLRIVNVQWQLQWPSDQTGTFQSYLGERGQTVHMQAWAVTLPSNVTSRLTTETNGNCSVLLGKQCAQSIVAAVSKTVLDTTSLDGCESTLDVGSLTGFGTVIGSNATRASALYSNSTLAFFSSEPYAAGNQTDFDAVTHTVQVLALWFEGAPPTNSTTYGTDYGATDPASVLCQIVDQTSAAHWLQPNAIMWAVVVLSTLAMMG